MFIDLAKSNRRELPRCDVAIIGAGAAGITLALELEKSGLAVIVLEGGYRDFTQLSQARYQGEVSTGVGFTYPDLDVWRLRYLGGTTNHWTGWCRRIEENVFGARGFGLGAGWPIARSDIEDDYHQAVDYCTLGRDIFSAPELLNAMGITNPIESNAVLDTPVWRFPKELQFGGFYRTRLQESAMSIYLGANCCGFTFEARSDRSLTKKVLIKNDFGTEFQLTARIFVLASGGIENTRQLLMAAQDVDALNRSDSLGRGFLEHPHGAIGAILCGDLSAEDLLGFTDYPRDIDDTQFKVGVGLNENLSAELGLINTSFTLEPLSALPQDSLHGRALKKLWESTRPRSLTSSSSGLLGLYARTEQRWNPDSKISLLKSTDDLGLPKARLDWRVADQDLVDIRKSMDLVGKELMKVGFGPYTCGDPSTLATMEGGGHHLGGTRMDADPDRGVVDADLLCHGIENLYVVGGSTFPTAGFSNPTLTVVALAVRLARILKDRN